MIDAVNFLFDYIRENPDCNRFDVEAIFYMTSRPAFVDEKDIPKAFQYLLKNGYITEWRDESLIGKTYNPFKFKVTAVNAAKWRKEQ